MIKQILSSAAVLALGLGVLTGTAHAQAIPSTSTYIGPGQEKWIDGSNYMVRSDDDFNPSGSFVTLTNYGRQGFGIKSIKDNSSSWSAYPYIGRGCAYGLCTQGSFPRKVADDDTPTAEMTTHQTWQGTYNTALDLWFSNYPNRDGHANATEIMIWTSHPGIPIPSSAITHYGVWVNGSEYNVMSWYANANREGVCPAHTTCWNYVAFIKDDQNGYFGYQYLNPFFRDVESWGLLKSSDYWTSIDAGFELCNGSGPHLAVKYFQATS
jgi:hypothetical protein